MPEEAGTKAAIDPPQPQPKQGSSFGKLIKWLFIEPGLHNFVWRSVVTFLRKLTQLWSWFKRVALRVFLYWIFAFVSLAVIALSYLGLFWVVNVNRHPTGWDSMPRISKLLLPIQELNLFQRIELGGVITSFSITFFIYFICELRGWNEQFPKGVRRTCMRFLPILMTFTLGLYCIGSIGQPILHLCFLSSFFIVFIVWDLIIVRTSKKLSSNQGIAKEMHDKAHHWLWYVDIPTPLILWTVYYLSKGRADHSSFISGCIASILISQLWGWLRDCQHFASAPKAA